MPVISKAEQIMKQINQQMKSDVLTMASDPKFVVEYIETGLLPIDILLGGGIPRGRFVTFVGDYSTLKSYVLYCTIAKEQERGGVCALIDTEKTFDPVWAKSLGVKLGELITPPRAQLQSGEQAIDYAEMLIRQGVDLIGFDSVAAALPQSERNKRLHDESNQPARLAALMSLALRKLTAANDKTAIIWTNQLRTNIGVTFGNPETATGGKALPYYSSMIMELKKATKLHKSIKIFDGEKNRDSRELVAQQFRATITKSKLNKPWREVYFDWSLEMGGVIDDAKFLMAQGLEHGIIVKSGNSWGVKGKTKKIIGREKFLDYLKIDDGLRAELTARVREVHELPGQYAHHSSAAGTPRRSKPKPAVKSSTRIPARVKPSKQMPLPKKKSTSTKILKKPIR